MGVNKVIYGTETLIDLTHDTVTEDALLAGVTAHDASGELITGNAILDDDPEFNSKLFLKKAGDTAEGNVNFLKGTGVFASSGKEGEDGYIKIATITINDLYINYPIIFEISGRDWGYPIVLGINFSSSVNSDPTLESFYTDKVPPFEIALLKREASIWDLCCKKNEPYGVIFITRFHNIFSIFEKDYYKNRIDITFQNDQISTLPENAIKPEVIRPYIPEMDELKERLKIVEQSVAELSIVLPSLMI